MGNNREINEKSWRTMEDKWRNHGGHLKTFGSLIVSNIQVITSAFENKIKYRRII